MPVQNQQTGLLLVDGAEAPTEVTFGATIKADPARFCAWAIYVLDGCATGRAVSRLHSHPAPVSRARCRR